VQNNYGFGGIECRVGLKAISEKRGVRIEKLLNLHHFSGKAQTMGHPARNLPFKPLIFKALREGQVF
jgi:hypothetical protein